METRYHLTEEAEEKSGRRNSQMEFNHTELHYLVMLCYLSLICCVPQWLTPCALILSLIGQFGQVTWVY